MDLDDWDELGPPEIRKVPTGHPKLRVAAIVGGSILAVGLVVAGAVWALNRPPAPEVKPAPSAVTTDTGNVTESFTVTESPTGTTTVATTTPPGTGGGGAPAPVEQFTRAAKVAYRLDGALWVADEAGTGTRKVVDSASGSFALSPDGKTLALVDGAAKTLAVVDVASSKLVTVGPADVRVPVWAPSSTWLAFTTGTEVRRVGRDGAKARTLGSGTHATIGPDARSFAISNGDTVTYVNADGKSKTIEAKGRVDDLALGSDRLFYALGGPSRSAVALHVVKLDGKGDKQIAGAPADAEAGRYDELALSPDGAWLAYAAAGDDMHSRLRTIRADGTGDVKLSLRHDDYLLRWSADGTKLLFIDGNVLQGDATQLMSIRPDGTQRVTVLKGAGM